MASIVAKSTISKLGNHNAPAYVYYNLSATNSSRTGTGVSNDPQARVQDKRTDVLITHPDQYLCSCVRFQLPLTDVPLGICPVILNQINIDLTIFTVSLSYDGETVSTGVVWSPEVPTAVAPTAPVGTSQNTGNAYYFIYSVQHLLDLINDTFKTCLADLITATGGGASAIKDANAPYLLFDEASGLLSLYGETAFFEQSSSDLISVYFNNNLLQWLPNFAGLLYENDTTLNYKLRIADLHGHNAYEDATTSTDYTYMTQSMSNFQQWNALQKIVLTTDLPINSEFISPEALYGQSTTNATGNNSNKILTDFILDNPNGLATLSGLCQYVPSVYRYCDMTTSPPVSSATFQFFWMDKANVLRPLRLSNGASFDIKVMFQRKE